MPNPQTTQYAPNLSFNALLILMLILYATRVILFAGLLYHISATTYNLISAATTPQHSTTTFDSKKNPHTPSALPSN